MRLAQLRTKAGLTQEELGRLTAAEGSAAVVHQTRISQYENGIKRPTLEMANRIVKVLNKHLKQRGRKEVAKIEDLLAAKKKRETVARAV